jgi:predicted ATPase
LADYMATGAALWVPDFLPLLAQAHGWAGQSDTGLKLLADALDRVERTEGRWLEAELHRVHGELLLTGSGAEHPEAEGCFRQALTVARKQGAQMWVLRAATSIAQLRADHGKLAEGRDLLAPVYAWFTEGFDTADLKEARALLDELT